MSLSRREFIKISATALTGFIGAATFTLVISNEINDVTVERVVVPITRLPEALEGYRIVQLSDIHLYPITSLDRVKRAVAMANALKPDLAVLTGDYVWRNVEAIYDLAPALASLDARQGVYAALGNHDLWADVEVVTQGFKEQSLPLLVNAGITLGTNSAPLYLAGLDDGWSGRPDLHAALAGAPKGAPVVLLLHEPDLADNMAADGRITLQLSGHSHGGQVRLPLTGPLVLPYLGNKYDFGLYNVAGMWLYTNRGLGEISIPLRYNCAPEVTEITLVRA